jgi:hypothetical protein
LPRLAPSSSRVRLADMCMTAHVQDDLALNGDQQALEDLAVLSKSDER